MTLNIGKNYINNHLAIFDGRIYHEFGTNISHKVLPGFWTK